MNLRRLIAILHPRLAVVAHDLAMIWLAWYGTNWLRWNLQIDPPPVPLFGNEYAIVLVAQTIILAWTGLYRGLWRFASLPDLWNIARASVLGALAIALGLFFLDRLEGTPRSVLLMYPIALMLLLGTPRMAYRYWKDSRYDGGGAPAKRVLVLGAGRAGETLARDLRREGAYRVVGFLDDKPGLRGANVHGVPVLGPIEQLPQLAREVAAEIRRFEEAGGASSSSSTGEALPGQSQSSSSQGSNNYRSSSTTSGSSSGSSGSSGSSSYRGSSSYSSPLKSPAVRFVIYVCMGLWIAAGIFYYYTTFSSGKLLVSPWLFILFMLLTGFIIAFVASKAFNIVDDPLDQVASGSGGVSLISFLWLFSHICPRCNKYMNVHTRTLHYATYSSSGLGEKTEHCDHCGYHRVSTYTIPRKTKSSSSSRSRGFGGGGGGGGRSSGGGGGASW